MALTALEFAILRTLLARPGFVFTRELILDAAYAGNIHVADRTIDSHVRNIRAKMAAAGCEAVIETVHGVGFKLGRCEAALTDAQAATRTPAAKWRPSLSLVVFVVLTGVLALPLFSLYFLKLYQNQLIQQTEAELIAQSAALAAVFHREIETAIPQGVALGARRFRRAAQKPPDEPYQPIWPRLELANESVLPPRPEARAAAAPADPAFVALGARMCRIWSPRRT